MSGNPHKPWERIGALANHGHTWTPQERQAFEHASLILDMHWLARDEEMPLRRPF